MARPGEQALHDGRRPVAGAALVLGAASLWATFGIFAKYLYQAGLEPLELASARAATGFAGIALVVLVRGLIHTRATGATSSAIDARKASATSRAGAPSGRGAASRGGGIRVPVASLPFFAAYGILGFALFGLLFLAALERTTVSIGVALLYTAPAFVVVISALLWRERFGGTRAVALALVLAGVVLVTGAAGSVLRGTVPLSASALLLGLGSGLGYALYTLFSKVATERYGPIASLFWSFAFAALALGALAYPWTAFARAPDELPLLVGLGVVPTLLPYALYLAALRHLRASTAAMLASIEPAVAASLAALLLSERMDALQMAGIALVVAAAVLLAREAAAARG